MARLITTFRSRWRRVCGGLAVLLMFLIPVTRVVLAQTSTSSPTPSPNNVENDYSDNTGASSGTSDSSPTTPANPSPMTSTGGTTSGSGRSSAVSGEPTGDSSTVPEPK